MSISNIDFSKTENNYFKSPLASPIKNSLFDNFMLDNQYNKTSNRIKDFEKKRNMSEFTMYSS